MPDKDFDQGWIDEPLAAFTDDTKWGVSEGGVDKVGRASQMRDFLAAPYRRLASTKLGAAAPTIALSWTGTYDRLWIATDFQFASAERAMIQFGPTAALDTGNNYALHGINNAQGAIVWTLTPSPVEVNQPKLGIMPGVNANIRSINMHMNNGSWASKAIKIETGITTGGAGTAGANVLLSGSWTNAAVANQLLLSGSAGGINLVAGSAIAVYGLNF